MGALQNAGHAALLFLPWRFVYLAAAALLWVLLGLCAVGLGIEGLQYFIGKDCDIQDVALDNLGAPAAFYVIAPWCAARSP